MKRYRLVNDQSGGNDETYKPDRNNKLKKIGEFNIHSNLIAGETDYGIIKGMKRGTYTAYSYGDDLVVCHDSKKLTKKILLDSKWKYSGVSVGVDGGTFSFLDESAGKNNLLRMPDIDIDALHDGVIVDNNDMSENTKCNEEDIGVMRFTGSGDGIFCSYVNGNSMALLRG